MASSDRAAVDAAAADALVNSDGATAVLLLVADKRLGLEDTLAEVLPNLVIDFPALAPVTIDQLLGMRSGIGDFFCCPGSLVGRVRQSGLSLMACMP